MSAKTRRISRISRSLKWGAEPDPEREFWLSPYAWDALGVLALFGFKYIRLGVELHDLGDFDTLRLLFRALAHKKGWQEPTRKQLDWGVEAMALQKDNYKKMDWYDHAGDQLQVFMSNIMEHYKGS
jgi:hypothetical protein